MPDVILLEELDGFTVETAEGDDILLVCGECGMVVAVDLFALADMVARARNPRRILHA